MVFIKDVSGNSDSGDATHWGGNDINFVDDYFDDVDITPKVAKINTRTYFRSGKVELRNPANTFSYIFIGAAIAANRNITLPLLTSSDTMAVLGFAQTFTAAQTFNSSMLKLRNPADTFSYTIVPAAIGADRNLNLPLITGTDTLASLGLSQTFTGTTTINSIKIGTNGRVIIADTEQTANRTFTFPDITDIVNTKTLTISNPYSGSGSSATLVRTGIFQPITDTNPADGILSSGLTITGTGGTVNDTTNGKGRSFATGAVANANAGVRWTNQFFRREWGNYMVLRVGFSSTSDIRVFIGWSSDTNDIAGETTLNNFSGCGVGKRTADTNWFTMRNDGDATEDRVDTSIAFATTVVTIELALDATSFRSKIAGTTQTAQTTEIPASTTMLNPIIQVETGAGAADKVITIYPIWAQTGTVLPI